MSKVVKITTDCRFAGCETIHFVEVPDDTDKDYLDSLIDDYIMNDIGACGGYEESSVEEAEEYGCEIE